MSKNLNISKMDARKLWIRAQGLDQSAAFGLGPMATQRAVEHLGYVQIDTINVIERCHHHILYSRIPDYQRSHLRRAQSEDKSIFEYWTHALAYVPTRDFRFYLRAMKRTRLDPGSWWSNVKKQDMNKVMRLIRQGGAISIRDINDDVRIEKTHAWGSTKPSKKALQLAFFQGRLVVSERQGMLKKYDLLKRHFNWETLPKAATEKQILDFELDRALRSQSIVSLDSICHLKPSAKPTINKLIEARTRKGELVPVTIQGLEKIEHWVRPEDLDSRFTDGELPVHLLSPFDPLIIQRKRLKNFFDFEYLFEAYVPKQNRKLGYFALPVLVDNNIVAAIDLKADREKNKLLIQKWTWLPRHRSRETKQRIESTLAQFEKFQLSGL